MRGGGRIYTKRASKGVETEKKATSPHARENFEQGTGLHFETVPEALRHGKRLNVEKILHFLFL